MMARNSSIALGACSPIFPNPRTVFRRPKKRNARHVNLFFVKSALFHLTAVLGLMLSTCAKAQTPVMQHWAQPNGLPSNTVFDVSQDANGYIWLGHEKGLSRFDGRDVRTYTHPKMNGMAVSNVFEDGEGRIWCQNFIGQKFFIQTDSMFLAERIPAGGNYASVVPNMQGDLAVGSDHHITVYDLHALTSEQRYEVAGYVITIHLQHSQLWVMTSENLYRLNGSELVAVASVSHLSHPNDYLLAEVGGRVLAFPKAGNDGFTFEIFPEQKKVSVLPKGLVVQSVKVYADSMVWVGTTGGLFLFDRNLQPLPVPQPLLADHSISGIMRDRDGAFWVATIDNGLFRIPDLNTVEWTSKDDVITVFSHRNDGADLLIGTESGKVVRLSDDGLKTEMEADTRHRVSVILHDAERDITVRASDKVYINRKQETVSLSAAGKDLLRTPEGLLVVAATGGLRVYDLSRPKQEPRYISLGTAVFRANSLTQHSRSGKVQVATSLGIWEFDPRRDTAATRLYGNVVANSLLWMGDTLVVSTQNGVQMFHLGQQVAGLGTSDGMDGAIGRLQLYDGSIYARSESRIYTISRSGLKVGWFGTSSIVSNSYISDFMLRDGFLYLASGSSIIRTAVPQQADTLLVPHLSITDLRSNERPIDCINPEVLNHDQNSIQLHYSFPWFSDPAAVSVQYRVNGSDWQTNEPLSRSINLPFLSPNDYTVEMRIQLEDGRVSPTETVRFRIRAPLFKRWWFQTALFVLFALAGYGLYRYRLRLMGRQNALLQEKLKLEQDLERSLLASIRSQMNPHFIFNALNTIQSYIYMNDRSNAVTYLGKFAQLTRKVLDMSTHEWVTLREELDALQLYLELEKMRFEETLEATVEVAQDIKADACRIPPMLIQPFVENALKHGLLHRKENRKLRCSFRKEGDVLVVSVSDNGIGRERSQKMNEKNARQHRSFSTEATQKRIELMNRTLPQGFSVEYTDHVNAAGEAEGTTVVLRMPIST